MSGDWGLIGRGIGVAAMGAAGVMLYVAGLSTLYVGRYAAGGGFLVCAAVLVLLFLRALGPYLDTLADRIENDEAA